MTRNPRPLPLPPEAELLLLAVAGPEKQERFCELLKSGLDWGKVVALVERDRTHILFWRRASAAGLDRIPAEPREQLRRLSQVAVFRQARLEDRLVQAVEVLAGSGIEVLLLKGAALAVSVYGSFASRPMADLDILVPQGSAQEAYRLLQSAGWDDVSYVPAERRDALYAGHHHLPPLADPSGSGVILEVHTEPLPIGHPLRLAAADLWRDALPVNVGGQPAHVPTLHHQLLHVCVHFAWAHCMNSGVVRMVRDVRALAGESDVDWMRVVSLAREARGATCVYWPLRLARNLVDAPVPAEVLDALAPDGSTWKLRMLERHFVATLYGGARCPSPRLARLLWGAAVAPRKSGHGAARPWLRQDAFADAGVTPSNGDEAGKSAWRDFDGWRRYLDALLSPARLRERSPTS